MRAQESVSVNNDVKKFYPFLFETLCKTFLAMNYIIVFQFKQCFSLRLWEDLIQSYCVNLSRSCCGWLIFYEKDLCTCISFSFARLTFTFLDPIFDLKQNWSSLTNLIDLQTQNPLSIRTSSNNLMILSIRPFWWRPCMNISCDKQDI